MHIKIDQSPRIEDWGKHSVIAFSDDNKRAIIVTSQLKREALAELEKRGKARDTAKWIILAAGIFLLIQEVLSETTQITMELEFDEKTMYALRNWLWQKIKRVSPHFDLDDIHCLPKKILKQDPAHQRAHELAYGIFTGRIKPEGDIRVKRGALLALIK